jgi:hypothetical protein
MYIVKNQGQFPVIIRDLSLHIAGGKEVDLDELFKRDIINRSVNLEKLINSKKLVLVNKEQKEEKKTSPIKQIVKKEKKQDVDNSVIYGIRKDLAELKEMLKNGIVSSGGSVSNIEEINPETAEKINKLRVANLSKEDYDIEKNFEEIGNATEKSEQLGDLLDVLDSLDESI